MQHRRALLALALLALATGCGQSADRAGGAAEDDSATPLAESPRAATGPARQAAETREAEAQQGRLTVQVTRPVEIRDKPGGKVLARVRPRTEFDSATILPVVRQHGDWLGVISTALPNNRIGWIPADHALVPYRTRFSIVATLHRHEVVVRGDGRVVLRFPVAIGSPSTPTPTGRFAVTDKLLTQSPSSPYGCCILALSAHQPNTPQGWGGGDRVAIHATNLPETIGTAASLGCMRGPADEVRRAVHLVPLGTIVTIRA